MFVVLWFQLTEERISNVRTVRAFGKELSEVRSYTEKTDFVLSLAKKEAVLRAGFFGIVSVCVCVCVCVCFIVSLLPNCVQTSG